MILRLLSDLNATIRRHHIISLLKLKVLIATILLDHIRKSVTSVIILALGKNVADGRKLSTGRILLISFSNKVSQISHRHFLTVVDSIVGGVINLRGSLTN